MLNILSKYLYVYLFFVFLLFTLLTMFSKNIVLNNNLVYIFTILLLPLFDYIFDFLKLDIKKIDLKLSGINIFKYLSCLLLATGLYIKGFSFLDISVLEFLFFGVLFRFDSRLSFIISLFSFLYISVFLLIGNNKIVGDLSTYAYYFLIIGVIFEISEFLFSKNKNKGKI